MPRIDPESVTAKDILEARLANLLEAYPTVDYVWLWEDEGMSWASQKQSVPLSVTPFKQAYDFLKRHAPEKRLVISGWGRCRAAFRLFPSRTLPEDIIFSSLNDNLGWDPVSEEYGKLEGRERWPIPWLEDDPAMWLPQFHVASLRARYGPGGTVRMPGPAGDSLAASDHGYRRGLSIRLLVEQGADSQPILPGFRLRPGAGAKSLKHWPRSWRTPTATG